mgnify:CR=1 FL=1
MIAQGFTDFVRVGSLRKIAKPVLPHVVHFSRAAKSEAEHDALALQELQDMLKSASAADTASINRAISQLKVKRSEQRAARLKASRIVGRW